MMYGLRLGPLEVAIEKHLVCVPGWWKIEFPGPGEVVLDLGKFSCMVTVFRLSRKTSPLKTLIVSALAAAILADAAGADVTTRMSLVSKHYHTTTNPTTEVGKQEDKPWPRP